MIFIFIFFKEFPVTNRIDDMLKYFMYHEYAILITSIILPLFSSLFYL